MKGKLYLLPNLLHAEASLERSFPQMLQGIVQHLDGLIAESAKEGRVFLKRFGRVPLQVPQSILNEHTPPAAILALLEPLQRGETWGYVADAGLPCLADPGALLVAKAREEGMVVEAIMGPSSLMFAIMLSGLPSQRFSFCGYLPQDPAALRNKIKALEKRSQEEDETEVFIETPYRNEKLLKALLEQLKPATKLCIASHLMAPDEFVMTKTVAMWGKHPLPPLDDKPTIFLLKS